MKLNRVSFVFALGLLAACKGGEEAPAEQTAVPAEAPAAPAAAEAAPAAPAADAAAAPAQPAADPNAAAAAPGGKPGAPAAAPAFDPTQPGRTCANPQLLDLSSGTASASGDLASYSNFISDRIEVTRFSWSGHEAYFAVDVEAGDTLTIALADGEFDGGVYVLTDCNNPVGSVVGGEDTDSRTNAVVTIANSGRHIIVADSFAGANRGAFTLTVTKTVNAKDPANTGIRGANTCAEITESITLPFVGVGDLAQYTNTIGDRIEVTRFSWGGHDAFYRIDAQAGQTITVTLDDQRTFDGGIYVFSDCNNPVGSVIGGLDTTPTTPAVITIPKAGPHYIAVDSWGSANRGTYTLRIQ